MNFNDLIPRHLRYETAAAEYRKTSPTGKGLVVLKECKTCGMLNFGSLTSGEQDAVHVEPLENARDCPRCMNVFNRAPEVYDWVMSALGTTLLNIDTRLEDDARHMNERLNARSEVDPLG